MGVEPSALFTGTTEERDALLVAVQAACACGAHNGRSQVCDAHLLLLNERVLKTPFLLQALAPGALAWRIGWIMAVSRQRVSMRNESMYATVEAAFILTPL